MTKESRPAFGPLGPGKATPGGGGPRVSRRAFVRGAAAASAVAALPRAVLSQPSRPAKPAPSAKLGLAAIGVGDQGLRDLKSFLARDDVRVIAVCDVDAGNRERARDAVKARQGEACPGYNDFREMLEKEAGIDAVLVVTPDHSHAAISIACMRKGKHVYCQKPMTHTVLEARRVAEAARASKVATQLGAVSQAGEGPRLLREWILDGAIGHVREVHNWSNRPIWPQEIDRPKDEPPVPPGLDWDLWLGPAPRRPYHPAYLPLVWRGWWDFGTGALGDMGCYSFDTIFRVLGLGAPEWVEASSSGFAPRMWAPVEIHRETYPRASIIRYRFPAREGMPPVDLTWCDGGLLPPRPDELDEDLPPEGLLFIGEKEKILCGFAGDRPRLIPRSRMDAYRKPPATLPRSPGHHEEWVRAIRGGEPAGANFEVSGRVTEALLLGNVAIRVRKKLLWDAAALKVTNVPEANPHLHAAYREPWTL